MKWIGVTVMFILSVSFAYSVECKLTSYNCPDCPGFETIDMYDRYPGWYLNPDANIECRYADQEGWTYTITYACKDKDLEGWRTFMEEGGYSPCEGENCALFGRRDAPKLLDCHKTAGNSEWVTCRGSEWTNDNLITDVEVATTFKFTDWRDEDKTDAETEKYSKIVETQFNKLRSCSKVLKQSTANTLKGNLSIAGNSLNFITIFLMKDRNIIDSTQTDGEGNYELEIPEIPGNYKFRYLFQCSKNNTDYFMLLNPDTGMVVEDFIELDINSHSDLIQNIKLEDYVNDNYALSFFEMYLGFELALYAYQEELEINFDKNLPLIIMPWAGESAKTRYQLFDGEHVITINDEHSNLLSEYGADMVEFHEFSHFAQFSMYNNRWPEPIDPSREEINHGGFANPSTADSFVEGFALFMGLILDEAINGPNRGVLTVIGSLETNHEVWDYQGKAEEAAVAGVLWDLYDSDSQYEWDRNLSLEFDLLNYRRELDAGWLTNKTVESIYAANRAKRMDDDLVEIPFEEIWSILKEYQQDFKSVYDAFVKAYPRQKKNIDEIFVSHGFFVDEQKGNGEFDRRDVYLDENMNSEFDEGEYWIDLNPAYAKFTEGETIGRAADPTRKDRRSVQPYPGLYIKTDKQLPFYEVTVEFPDQPHLNYRILERNNEGLVYVPVPPEKYNATLSLIGHDVTTGKPLVFTTEKFFENYDQTLDQGYFVEHDFDISGPIPADQFKDTKRKTSTSKSRYIYYMLIIAGVIVWAIYMIKSGKKRKKKVK